MGQTQHHVDGSLRVVVVVDALVIKLMRDEWLLQLPVPQLQQGGWEGGEGEEGEEGRWE